MQPSLPPSFPPTLSLADGFVVASQLVPEGSRRHFLVFSASPEAHKGLHPCTHGEAFRLDLAGAVHRHVSVTVNRSLSDSTQGAHSSSKELGCPACLDSARTGRNLKCSINDIHDISMAIRRSITSAGYNNNVYDMNDLDWHTVQYGSSSHVMKVLSEL